MPCCIHTGYQSPWLQTLEAVARNGTRVAVKTVSKRLAELRGESLESELRIAQNFAGDRFWHPVVCRFFGIIAPAGSRLHFVMELYHCSVADVVKAHKDGLGFGLPVESAR
jgi:hypothetical protein